MVFQASKPLLPCGVSCFGTMLLLVCLLLCCSHGKSYKPQGFKQDPRESNSLSSPSEQSSAGEPPPALPAGSLGSSTDYFSSAFFISDFIPLWETGRRDGMKPASRGYSGMALHLYYASFSIDMVVSIYQQMNNKVTKASSSSMLVFAIHPVDSPYHVFPNSSLCPLSPSDPSRHSKAAEPHISADIVSKGDTILLICVQLEKDNSSAVNKYHVWIEYNDRHHMLVYVDSKDGTSEPKNPILDRAVNNSGVMAVQASMSIGLFSTSGKLIQIDNTSWSVYRQNLLGGGGYTPYESPENGNGTTTIVSSVLGSAAAAAFAAAAVYLYLNSKYRRWKVEQEKIAKTMERLPGVPTQVGYADIKKATKNFHETMRLGKGGFGSVYGCTLPAPASGKVAVAVKKFMREVEQRRYDDFLAEVSIINRLRHKNIVPLVGWSYNKGEPLLIYEYMTNGSLDQHLFRREHGTTAPQHHDQTDTSIIEEWHIRYVIVKDIATGLHYIHHEHEPVVLHRDIKASNIMVDSTFHARLGDFGIASTVAVGRSSVTGIVGTWGYIAPEYAMTYRSTRQTDIYAFGVLILEIVTGKKNGDVPPEDDHITDWVWRLHKEGKLLETVDRDVLTTGDDQQQNDNVADEANRLLLLGLACTNPNPSDRPSMVEALQVITKLAPPPSVPLARPAFMWPPEDWRSRDSVYSTAVSNFNGSSTTSTFELVRQEQRPSAAAGGHASVDTSRAGNGSHGRAASWSHSGERQNRP